MVDKRYLREIPLDPVSGTRAWEPVPFPNGTEPGIYDIRAPALPGNAATPSQELAPPSGSAP